MRGAVTFNQFVIALVFVVSLAVATAVFGIMYLAAGSEPQPEVPHAVCDWEATDAD